MQFLCRGSFGGTAHALLTVDHLKAAPIGPRSCHIQLAGIVTVSVLGGFIGAALLALVMRFVRCHRQRCASWLKVLSTLFDATAICARLVVQRGQAWSAAYARIAHASTCDMDMD